ncbi:hypothetical protein TTRE_0000340601 [Trichuris trichiura]|uniref:Uncharacterized protein n=1 Tax=Trichuris trichiura TaxID=36087 RepID=A0A077Z905_TRITR|nr:hypothetical protein TTRE_0000340601 [Trichuris trichiura]
MAGENAIMLNDSSPLLYEAAASERISRFLEKIKMMPDSYQDSVQFRVDVAELAVVYEIMEKERKGKALNDEELKDYSREVLNYCCLAEEDIDSYSFISDASSDMSEEKLESDEDDAISASYFAEQTFNTQASESELESLVFYTGNNASRIRRALLGVVKTESGPSIDDSFDFEQQQIEEEEELLGKFSTMLQHLRKNAVVAGEILREDTKVHFAC